MPNKIKEIKNMRKISFRAWNKNEKRMVYRNQYEWMQSTGLKDRNGVEIYEGDIVSICKGKSIGIVKYTDCRFEFEYIKNGFKNYSQSNYLGVHSSKTNQEIIGNIHENPELLS